MQPPLFGRLGREYRYMWPQGTYVRPEFQKIKKLYDRRQPTEAPGYPSIWEAITHDEPFRKSWCVDRGYPKLMFDPNGYPMEKPMSQGGPVPDEDMHLWAQQLGITIGEPSPCPKETSEARHRGVEPGYHAKKGAEKKRGEKRDWTHGMAAALRSEWRSGGSQWSSGSSYYGGSSASGHGGSESSRRNAW